MENLSMNFGSIWVSLLFNGYQSCTTKLAVFHVGPQNHYCPENRKCQGTQSSVKNSEVSDL